MSKSSMTATTMFSVLESPLGPLVLTGDHEGALTGVWISPDGQAEIGEGWARDEWLRDNAGLGDAAAQLREYFAGTRQSFSLRFAVAGTPFEESVWAVIDSIEFGQTLTYGQIAAELGAKPGAARAVGGATGRNPLMIVRPCHRVLGAGGAITGFAGGLPAKEYLLRHEGITL